jgi:hypothetical protein
VYQQKNELYTKQDNLTANATSCTAAAAADFDASKNASKNADGVSLGTIGNNVSPVMDYEYFEGKTSPESENLLRRYVRQQTARKHSESPELANCLRAIIPGRDCVEVHGGGGRAHFRNLQTCNRVWICPVCAAKITERRRRALAEGLEALKLYPVMITVTSAHTAQTRLGEQFRAMAAAWRGMVSGKLWIAFKAVYGVGEWVRSAEITTSRVNGWHTHFHILLLLERPLGSDDLELMQADARRRWLAALASRGLTASFERGLTLIAGNDALALYIAKFGHEPSDETKRAVLNDSGWTIAHEVTKSPVKTGRTDDKGVTHYTPFELLDLIAGDDSELAAWARQSWREYQAATKGHRQLVTSRGFPVDLTADPEPGESDDTGEESVLAELLAELPRSDWWALLRLQKRLKPMGLDVRALLLDVARLGDAAALAAWIADRLAEADEIKAHTAARRENYLGAIERGMTDQPPPWWLVAAQKLRREGWRRVPLPENTQTQR